MYRGNKKVENALIDRLQRERVQTFSSLRRLTTEITLGTFAEHNLSSDTFLCV